MLDSVKKFHGTQSENVCQWYDRNAAITEMSEVKDEAAKLLPLFLEDAAYASWSQLDDSVKEDLR